MTFLIFLTILAIFFFGYKNVCFIINGIILLAAIGIFLLGLFGLIGTFYEKVFDKKVAILEILAMLVGIGLIVISFVA